MKPTKKAGVAFDIVASRGQETVYRAFNEIRVIVAYGKGFVVALPEDADEAERKLTAGKYSPSNRRRVFWNGDVYNAVVRTA